MALKLILAKLNDPMVPGGKIGHIRTPGPLTGVCAGTGETLTYEPDRLYDILEVAKNWAAAKVAGWVRRPPERVVQPATPHVTDTSDADIPGDVVKASSVAVATIAPAPSKPKVCPECKGQRRGRGYAHAEGCSQDSRNTVVHYDKDKAVCPECKGTRRGRGFAHRDGCKLSCHAVK